VTHEEALVQRITQAATEAVGRSKYVGVHRPKWTGPTHIDARYGRAAAVAVLKVLADDVEFVLEQPWLTALAQRIEEDGP
jgi:hypothetical protein